MTQSYAAKYFSFKTFLTKFLGSGWEWCGGELWAFEYCVNFF